MAAINRGAPCSTTVFVRFYYFLLKNLAFFGDGIAGFAAVGKSGQLFTFSSLPCRRAMVALNASANVKRSLGLIGLRPN